MINIRAVRLFCFVLLRSCFSRKGVGGRSDGGADGLRLGAGTGGLGRLGQARLDLHWGSADPGLLCFFVCFVRLCLIAFV